MSAVLILVVVAIAAIVGVFIWWYLSSSKEEPVQGQNVPMVKTDPRLFQVQVQDTPPKLPEVIVRGPGSNPNDISGLVGWFTASSWDTNEKIWKDMSGKDNHATQIIGNPTARLDDPLLPHIQGTREDGVVFPEEMMGENQQDYTLFHVARYTGTQWQTRGRIVTQAYSNKRTAPGDWFSGFHGGRSGVCFHKGFLTPIAICDPKGPNFGCIGVGLKAPNDWVISTDKKNMYRANGEDRVAPPHTRHKYEGEGEAWSTWGGGTAPVRIGINGNVREPWWDDYATNTGGYHPHEHSDWAVAEIIVYDRELNEEEIGRVEAYLVDTMKPK